MNKLRSKLKSFLDSRFTQKQQVLGAISMLVVIMLISVVFTLTSNQPMATEPADDGKKDSTETVETNPTDPATEAVNLDDIPEEDFFVVEEGDPMAEDITEEDLANIDNGPKLEGATLIGEKNIAATKAEVIDSNDQHILFIGHAGVLSLYNKETEEFSQIDNPVKYASLSNDGDYVVFSNDTILGSYIHAYDIEKHALVEIVRFDNRFITDVKMHNGLVSYIHHAENTTEYVLDTMTHFDERADKTPQELIGLNLNEVGPKLFMDEDHIYFFDKKDSSIRAIHPGLHERKVASIKADNPEHFVLVKGKTPFYVDGDTLKNGKGEITKEGSVTKLLVDKENVYYTNGSGLYLINGDESSVFDRRGARASFNGTDLVIQDLTHEAYLVKQPVN